MRPDTTRPNSNRALLTALLCAAPFALAACGAAPIAGMSGDGNGNGTYSGALNGAAPSEEHHRAFTGWNSNAVGVSVISGTGRPQLR